MLDFLGSLAGIIITLVTVAGFLALGVVFLFELITTLTLLYKDRNNPRRPSEFLS